MYQHFNFREIKPEGWLRRQLEIQAAGLSGNLDKIWPDVRDSAWIGGSREGWERVPYWLDGFIPLAHLLDDADLIARADKYIDAILERQKPDGWICPCKDEERTGYDVWAFFLIGKVLALYCEFAEDTRYTRAFDGLYRAMKCLYEELQSGRITLAKWGKFRWYECMIPLAFIYDREPEEWIRELSQILEDEGEDYGKYTETWVRPLNKWTMYTHTVNLCMMLKYEAVTDRIRGKVPTDDNAEAYWKLLTKYNGTAVGTLTGDECLSGIDSNRGTELCSVVELMYSCEVLYMLTGKRVWADRLEKAAFNALPATISDDMWTHQYDQQTNQIACKIFPGKTFFRTNSSSSHLFGLEPHFGCCTANFNQGWPKLALHTFLRGARGIHVAMLLPATLQTTIGGVGVKLTCETEYPFRHTATFKVKVDAPVRFALSIRLPAFAKQVTLCGKPVNARGHITLNRKWRGEETLTLTFSDTPHLVNRPYGLKVVEYGPLVFSLPIETEYRKREYERDGVVRKFPYCDYELLPHSEWRYGFADKNFEVVEEIGDDIPFSSKAPRLTLRTKLSRADWEYADGYDSVADRAPKSNVALSAPEDATLYPYGCAKLRMTEMPLLHEKKQ